MCRFLVYKGSDAILLSKLIIDPAHSILKQSFDSRLRLVSRATFLFHLAPSGWLSGGEQRLMRSRFGDVQDTRRGQNNADGFGIGFYTDPKLGAAPCMFTSTIPAWNCTNLQRIASKTASRLIFGHVRATTEGSLSEDNCHPFTHGSLMWMHNGNLGSWKHIKRRLAERLDDRWYLGVKGGTDSEWAFALFLDTLQRLGDDASACPETGFGPTVLRNALEQMIAQINQLTNTIPEDVVQSEGVDKRSLLNFAVTDGHSVICSRYFKTATVVVLRKPGKTPETYRTVAGWRPISLLSVPGKILEWTSAKRLAEAAEQKVLLPGNQMIKSPLITQNRIGKMDLESFSSAGGSLA